MAISVVLPDGKSLSLESGATSLDAARAISVKLADVVVVARVDGEVQDLRVPLHDGASLTLLKADSPEGRDTINHSAEHLLAMAVLRLFSDAKVTMGPKTHDEGFYYDFDLGGRTLTPDDLKRIEAEMRKFIAQRVPFERQVVKKSNAVTVFESEGQSSEYKQEILSWIPDDEISIYRSGDFVDICRGPHLPHAGFIKGIKVTTASAAYWRADASNQSLQRVRGVAFPKKGEVDAHVRRLEEAKKRDHRGLGRDLELFLVSERYDSHAYDAQQELDLYVGVEADTTSASTLVESVLNAANSAFLGRTLRRTVKLSEPTDSAEEKEKPARLHIRLRGAIEPDARARFKSAVEAIESAEVELHFESQFVEEIGAGLVMWLPKGGLLRSVIEDHWRTMHLQAGYDLVYSPHIAKADLWKVSGHWDFYRDGMFSPMSIDGQDYCCKPMNCPFHVLMVKSRNRSYREFPMRLAELGTVYRYEPTGVMHGLMRVRGFTQDDAHLFCRADQIDHEIHRVLEFIVRMLRTFGFEQFEINLSTRPEKYVGSLEDWAAAEQALETAVQRLGFDYQVDPGGGAFYGPKIDIQLVDALERKWQCSTLQYDFNNPERFHLGFVNAQGEIERPIMLHRALLGSIERFIGILLEHYAGALPGWLAPEQARVLTVSDKHNAHAEGLVDTLRSNGIRAHFTPSSEKLGAKIRSAQLEKIPFMLVAGDKEVEAQGATVRLRDGTDRGFVATDDLVKLLREGCAVPSVP